MVRYRAVFFDLDRTLVDERAGVPEARAAGAAALRSLGQEVSDAAFGAAVQLMVERTLERHGGQWPGVWSREALMADALRELGLEVTAAARVSDAYAAARIERLQLLEGAEELLAAVSERVAVGLISNGPGPEQRAKLRRAGLARYFRATTVSGDLGTPKPAPQIFQAALRSLEARAEESVHVGNNYEHDIVGARGAGMGAIWLNAEGESASRHDCEATAVVRSLREVPALLGF